MLKSFQEMAIEKIVKMAEDHHFTCSQSSDWSNVGTINIHQPNNITPIGQVYYNFQPGTYTLSMRMRSRTVLSQPGRADYYDFHFKNDKASTFWDAFGHELTKLATE